MCHRKQDLNQSTLP